MIIIIGNSDLIYPLEGTIAVEKRVLSNVEIVSYLVSFAHLTLKHLVVLDTKITFFGFNLD